MSKTTAGAKSGRPRVTRRPLPRRYAPSEIAMQHMLTAAEAVLIRDGYHGFSTRRVATECGVSVGHLTYYFPTKIELLRAMISDLMARYTERLRQDLATTQPRSRADVAQLIVWLLRDTVTPEASGLFRELWVMAKHDTVVAREVIKFYQGLIESFVELVVPLYPEVDRRRLQLAAHLLATLTEGSTVIFADPGERTVSYEEMIPLAAGVVMSLLEAPAADVPLAKARYSRTGTRG
ncbi:MAG: TetR/AcrR family transcriptional regulator [Xanthomonadales bacterium]|nr:TetR/AcrR family transcriptional regulator [Xanthomonadales bacterium]